MFYSCGSKLIKSLVKKAIPVGMSLTQYVCPIYNMFTGWFYLNGQHQILCLSFNEGA